MRIMAAIAMRLFGGGRAGWEAEADGAEGPSSGSRASSPAARVVGIEKNSAPRGAPSWSLVQSNDNPPSRSAGP